MEAALVDHGPKIGLFEQPTNIHYADDVTIFAPKKRKTNLHTLHMLGAARDEITPVGLLMIFLNKKMRPTWQPRHFGGCYAGFGDSPLDPVVGTRKTVVRRGRFAAGDSLSL